ncbi:MAG: TonB family protein [Candidatus Sulfotelmatobacter sp.]
MGYQALLFCPDEKTARTVTQVLSELEFNVESCTEPFAAVKKLMGQHFDAVVVDCDNEQNATLLFKSARNSTSNQASLAVAVVEGQAGVAKAFRIGANLVLTKPINIEQAKGTLRVARGLLRKGEPAKPLAPAAAPAPPIPVAAKPVPQPRPATPAAPSAVSAPRPAPRPAAIPVAKPVETPAWPAPTKVAAATSIPAARNEDVLEVRVADATAEPSPAPPVVPAHPEVKTAMNAGLPAARGSAAASAPAPAREAQGSPATQTSPANSPVTAQDLFEKPAEAVRSESYSIVGSAPSFSFGGANEPAESNGGTKKIFIGVAAAAIVAAGLYAGWSHFQGRASTPATTQAPASAVPVSTPQIPKPSGAQPATSSAEPATSAPLPRSPAAAAPITNQATGNTGSDTEEAEQPSVLSPASSATNKTSAAAKPAASPLVVKGGTAPAVQAQPAVPDSPPPSMPEIATAGAGAPPPNLVGGEGSAPRPVLQSLNISQGVSQGLLLKKVQPVYPRSALNLKIEGTVELMATIAKTGGISQVKTLSGDSQLARAASDAVKQWKYRPYLLNGEPVEIQTQVTINFKLPK